MTDTTTTTTTATTAPALLDHDRHYRHLRTAIAARLAAVRGPLFTTDADGDGGALFAAFLDGLDPTLRQHYTCSACRKFFQHFGGLVTIDTAGEVEPVVWADDTAKVFGGAMRATREKVAAATVTGVFLSGAKVWGRPETGEWTHFYGEVDQSLVFKHPLLTAGRAMAEKREDHGMLERALADYTRAHLKTALRLLDSESLYRGEKILGVAQWLDGLMEAVERVTKRGKGDPARTRRRTNLLWRAVAMAPPGFCHVRSSMIGTLLDDIAADKPFAAVEAAFRAKMHPLQYQRPQVAPKAGNVKQAEAIVEKLQSAGALRRRFARLDDMQLLWRSAARASASLKTSGPGGAAEGGVFGAVRKKKRGAKALDGIPAKPITWVKFRAKVLSAARAIEIMVGGTDWFYAFVTAADPDAPPIVQWDREDRRNPVTWYTYAKAQPAVGWGLSAGWHPVTGVGLFPHLWHDEETYRHQQKGAVFVIEGCRAPAGGGLGLFPEFMRSEYHPVRATIEAFSQGGELEDRDAASACGLAVRPGSDTPLRVRVTGAGGEVVEHLIDRWD
ncbi:MAG: hypothetical protein H6701_14245 [Myxococcales bacterium]|nr:hypothetical protein [Myxococcales bacterium]